MKLLIDDANISEIKSLYDYFPISGVTTNPSILARTKRNPLEVLKEIRAFIGKDSDLHAQVIGKTAESMIEDGHVIVKALGSNTFIKIPCIPEGFKAMKKLVSEGFKVTGTAIYTPMQAYLAAECGASWLAPYVNRIDNMGYNGIQTAIEIQDILDNNGLKAQILGASFKNSQQILELCKYGVGAVTAAPDIIRNFVKNPAIDSAVETFVNDFEKIVGKDKTMSNL